MGQRLVGIIANKLTPREIVDLPEKMNQKKPLGIPGEIWGWEIADVSQDFLEEYWTRNEEWYINELKNKRYDRIYKYPSIEVKETSWSVLFMEPTLICIYLPLEFSRDRLKDLHSAIERINAAKRLAQFFEQRSMVLTSEPGSGDTEEEITGKKFGDVSNMLQSFKRNKRDFRQINF